MWKQLLRALTPRVGPDSDPADTSAPYHVYRVNLPEGLTDVVSLLPGDIVFASGLAPEAIVGGFVTLLENGEGFTEANFRPHRPFLDLLHDVIATDAPTLPELQDEARRQQTGWHRLFSANGLFKLDPRLHEKLVERVIKR
jgi:hypothetical protein